MRRSWFKLSFTLPVGLATIAVVAAVVVPLEMSSGSPGMLNNASGSNVTWSGYLATPDRIVSFPVEVQDPFSSDAVLQSASLLSVPGFPLPQLLHVVVLREHRVLETSAVGWPITADGCVEGIWKCEHGSVVLATSPLHGYVVQSHDRHARGPLPDMIMYAVVGTRVRAYAVAGLILTYLVGSTLHHQDLYEVASCGWMRERDKRCTAQRLNSGWRMTMTSIE